MTQRSRKRWMGVIAVPAVGALVLAGCTGGDTDTPDGPQEFSLSYALSASQNAFEALAKEYMAEFPDVTITLNPQPNEQYDQTLRTQLQGGNASDVFVTSPGSGQNRSILPLADAGFLEPLGDTANELIPSGAESQFTVDGEVYGQAVDITWVGMVANLTALEKAGFDEFPASYDEVEDVCSAMAANGGSFLSLAGAIPPNTGYMAMVLSATRVYADDPEWNAKRLADEVTFADSKGWQDTLQTVIDLNDAGCFQAGVEGGDFGAITVGVGTGESIAAFVPANAVVNFLDVDPTSEFVVQAFPPASSSDAAFGFASANYALSINAASENKEAAQAFLAWAATPEAAALYAELDGSIPISGIDGFEFAGSPYEAVAEILQSGSFAPLPNASWTNAAVYDALATGVQGLLTGQKSVDDVLTAMDAAW